MKLATGLWISLLYIMSASAMDPSRFLQKKSVNHTLETSSQDTSKEFIQRELNPAQSFTLTALKTYALPQTLLNAYENKENKSDLYNICRLLCYNQKNYLAPSKDENEGDYTYWLTRGFSSEFITRHNIVNENGNGLTVYGALLSLVDSIAE